MTTTRDSSDAIGHGGNGTSDRLRDETMIELRLLVEALDRRVSRLDRAGEARILEEAADLRRKAVSLIAKIKSHETGTL